MIENIVMTTYDIQVFKYFVKYHDLFFKQNKITTTHIFVDTIQDDVFQQFKDIYPQTENIVYYSKKMIMDYCKDFWLEGYTTMNKMYFIYYLLKQKKLTDLYFTDDDVIFRGFDYTESNHYSDSLLGLTLKERYGNEQNLKKYLENTKPYSVLCGNFYINQKDTQQKLYPYYPQEFYSFCKTIETNRFYEKSQEFKRKGKRAPGVIFIADSLFWNYFYKKHIMKEGQKPHKDMILGCGNKKKIHDPEKRKKLLDSFLTRKISKKDDRNRYNIIHFNVVDKVEIMRVSDEYLYQKLKQESKIKR